MLAVLPFDNLSSDPSQDYFAEGMTEELITQLGKWNPDRLGVIARTSVDLYKNANRSVAQVGRELGVDYIVEGSARRDGDLVRITAQLIRVRDQTHVWAREYDRTGQRTLAIENDVAADVATEISVRLSPSARAESVTDDPNAYEDFLKGKHYWNQLNCRGFEAALPLFESALRKDPKFALAQAWLAATYYKLAEFRCRPAQPAFTAAKEAALLAIQQKADLAKGHAVLGIVADEYDWDRVRSQRELKLATQLDPNDAIAHLWYGGASCMAGNQDLCLTELKKAHDLDPVALITNAVNAYGLYLLRRYDDALVTVNRTLELFPEAGNVYFLRGAIYERMGDEAHAVEDYMKGLGMVGTPPPLLERYRTAIAREGLRGYWKAQLEDAQAQVSPDECGMLPTYAHLGDRQEVLRLVDINYQRHCPETYGLNDPIYDFVRQDPQFLEVLRKAGRTKPADGG